MASVDDILTRVKELALVGSDDSSADTRLMMYVNDAYAEIYGEIATLNQAIREEETITITDGAGTLSKDYLAILLVTDWNYNVLEPQEYVDIKKAEPRLNSVGSPYWYYRKGSTDIGTYPKSSGDIEIIAVPRPATLASTDAESAIKIPVEHHNLLVWKTLTYMAYDERDKGAMQEISTAQALYKEGLSRLKSSLVKNQTKKKSRVMAYD